MNDKVEESITPTSLNYFKDGVFYIYGVFDESIAKEIIPNLIKEVDKQSGIKNGKIIIYIDSPGGYAHFLYSMLALIEKAKKNGVIVETHAYSYAYSCASMLACSGSKGHRYISFLSQNLPHLGAGSTGIVKNDVELERSSNRIQRHFNTVRDLYKKYANIPDLENIIKFDDFFIYGQQIIDYGLADIMVD